jgi:hypothetical protein
MCRVRAVDRLGQAVALGGAVAAALVALEVVEEATAALGRAVAVVGAAPPETVGWRVD